MRKPRKTQHFARGLWTAVWPKTLENPSQSRFVSQPLDFVGVRFRGFQGVCRPWLEFKRAQSYKSMSYDVTSLIVTVKTTCNPLKRDLSLWESVTYAAEVLTHSSLSQTMRASTY